MPKRLLLSVFIILVCWILASAIHIGQPSGVWLFNPTAVMDFLFAKNANVIVVGHLTTEALAEGVRLYSDNPPHISGVKILSLRVEEVVKGSGISRGTEIQALILPWVDLKLRPFSKSSYENTMKWDPRKAFEELRKTGHLPADAPPQEEGYPEIADGQEGIFGLFPASFEDSTGSMMWLGADKLNQGKPLFGCSGFFPMDVNHQGVKVLQRYLEIGAIKDRQEQLRELAHFSLSLLKNPQTPEVIAIGAAADAVAALPDDTVLPKSSGFEKKRLEQSIYHLDDQGVKDIVQIAADPSRPPQVREKLLWMIYQLSQNVGRPIDFQPLFRAIEDPRENLDNRALVAHMLGGLDNSEVRRKFEEILSKPPADHADKYIHDEIRASKIMKQAQNQ